MRRHTTMSNEQLIEDFINDLIDTVQEGRTATNIVGTFGAYLTSDDDKEIVSLEPGEDEGDIDFEDRIVEKLEKHVKSNKDIIAIGLVREQEATFPDMDPEDRIPVIVIDAQEIKGDTTAIYIRFTVEDGVVEWQDPETGEADPILV